MGAAQGTPTGSAWSVPMVGAQGVHWALAPLEATGHLLSAFFLPCISTTEYYIDHWAAALFAFLSDRAFPQAKVEGTYLAKSVQSYSPLNSCIRAHLSTYACAAEQS